MHLLDELFEHLLGDGEVGDHAVLHRADDGDGARCLAKHFLGFLADGLDGFGIGAAFEADGDDRWLVEDNGTHVDQRVCRAKVDGEVV
jgi:hypothetical protein